MSLFDKNKKTNIDYEAQIAELKAKLQTVEQEKAILQSTIAQLQTKPVATTYPSEITSEKLQIILSNLTQELSKLPTPSTPDNINLYARYNILSVMLQHFCVPLLQEFGMHELSNKMKIISTQIKQDGPEILAGRLIQSTLSGKTKKPIDIMDEKFKQFINCDAEKQQTKDQYLRAIKQAEYTSLFTNFIYNMCTNDIVPTDSNNTKQWFEKVIQLASWTHDFSRACASADDDYATGIMSHLLGKTDKRFTHKDPMYSGETANRTYELLLKLAKEYGIDLSKMRVYAHNLNICQGHYQPNTLTNNIIMPPSGERE